MPPTTLIFAGGGAFGVPTLRHLASSADFGVALVATQPDRPAGRGRKTTPTPVADAAEALGLPLLKTADLNAEELPDADAMVVIAFGQKLSPAVVDRPRLGSINLHASLVPKYRGAAPIHWAILGGETHTGNSVIRLAERMDAGDVLAQSTVEIGDAETTGELHDRLAADGPSIIDRVLRDLANGTATETPQDHAAATPAPKLSRESATFDPARPAAIVARQVNGLSPWPGVRVRLLDGSGEELDRLTLLRAAPSQSPGTPGVLNADGTVGASAGSVAVLDVLPEGKRPMALDAYRRGKPWPAGGRIVAAPA